LSDDRELAPPACPTAPAIADKLHATKSAREWLDRMKSRLLQFRAGLHSAGKDSIDLEYCEGRWNRDREVVTPLIELCGRPDFAQELQSLDADWKEFVREHSQMSAPQAQKRAPDRSDGVRLEIRVRTRAMVLDGKEFPVTEQMLTLLLLLAERAKHGNPWVGNREIEVHLWGDSASTVDRTIRDVIRSLRESLSQGAENDSVGHDLVKNRQNFGYSLSLDPEEIEIVG
jgi:DNA-binding winged helix-turn-helix (wHTH) protein